VVYMREKCAAAAADYDDAVTSCRISEYKHNTLPVLGYLEDIDKLDMIPVIAVYNNCIVCLHYCRQEVSLESMKRL